jgi:hypothetical protein
VPRGFGFVYYSIAILYHQVPNLSITIRIVFIAVGKPLDLASASARKCGFTPSSADVADWEAEQQQERLEARKWKKVKGEDDDAAAEDGGAAWPFGFKRRELKVIPSVRAIRDFGWEIAHAAATRRPPIPPYTSVARIEGLHVQRWGLGFVHRSRTIFCRAAPNLSVAIRKLFPPLYGRPRGS